MSGTDELYTKDLVKDLDHVELILLYMGSESILPEIYEVVGTERLAKFLEIFGGMTVRVPDREVFRKAARDVSIFVACKSGSKKLMSDLCREYDLSMSQLESIYKDANEKIGMAFW